MTGGIRTETRDVQAAATRAAVAPSSINEEKRTVDVVWTTGERVVRGFGSPFLEELSLDPGHVRLDRLNNGAPVLDSHRSWDTRSVVGAVDSVRIENGRGVATVRFAEGDSVSDGIWRKITQGILRNVSVGYRVHRLERLDEEGEGGLPVYRATNWEPMEISVVPIGADSGASIRNAEGARTNRCEFVELAERVAMEKQEAVSPAPASPAEETRAAPVDPMAIAEAERKARADERERIAAIGRMGKSLRLDADFIQRHVDDGTGLDKFRALAIDEHAKRDAAASNKPDAEPSAGHDIRGGLDEADKFQRCAVDWICTRAGVANVVAEADKRDGGDGKLDPGFMRGMTFVDMARECLERRGVNTRGMARQKILADALSISTRIGGLNTTGDFPVILENTMYKILLAQYAITPDQWSAFCAVGSVSDFRPHNRLRMGTFGRLEQVNEAGEFRNKSIPDARKETISASTYGNIIGLSRQALINDDLSAFQRLATMLGRAARLSIEVDVFALLEENAGLGPNMSDGNPLFDASHANLGGGAALSIAAIDADCVVMAEQMDESGNEILNLRPSVLVVPIGLESLANNINRSEFDIDAGAVHSRVPNVVQGKFSTIVGTPRLSGTRRYMFAAASEAPTIEVVFLDGNQSPYLESRDGWSVDGVEWKVRLDYGVGAIDYRGALTDAGA